MTDTDQDSSPQPADRVETTAVLIIDALVLGNASSDIASAFPTDDWHRGPFPVEIPGNANPANAATRASLMKPRVARILYGTGRRYWRTLPEPVDLRQVLKNPESLPDVVADMTHVEVLVEPDLGPFWPLEDRTGAAIGGGAGSDQGNTPAFAAELLVHVQLAASTSADLLQALYTLLHPRPQREKLCAVVLPRTGVLGTACDRFELVRDTTAEISQYGDVESGFTITSADGSSRLIDEKKVVVCAFVPGKLPAPPDQEDEVARRLWNWAMTRDPSRHDVGTGWRPQVRRARVATSADWQASVTRQGLAVAMIDSPDAAAVQRPMDPDTLAVYTRTVYTDAVLLARMQGHLMDRLSEQTARVALASRAGTAPDAAPSESLIERITRTDSEVLLFRTVYWWQRASESEPFQEILERAQEQSSLPEELASLWAESGALRANLDLQLGRVARQDDQTLSTAMGVVGFIGLPASVALGLMGAASHLLSQTWMAVLLGVMAFLLMLVHPGMRAGIARTIFLRGRVQGSVGRTHRVGAGHDTSGW